MKPLYIIGNWKSNVTVREAQNWMEEFTPLYTAMQDELSANTHVILCVPFPDLFPVREHIRKYSLNIALGAQDVSPYPEGSYTGEVSARMIKELGEYVIIGHSERRKFLGESDEELAFEVMQAKEAGLQIIFCIPDDQTRVFEGVDIIGYEPLWAIGTGKTDTPQHAASVIASIKQKTGVPSVVYGGSVKQDNVAAFVAQDSIDGVLVGGASLDPRSFAELINSSVYDKR